MPLGSQLIIDKPLSRHHCDRCDLPLDTSKHNGKSIILKVHSRKHVCIRCIMRIPMFASIRKEIHDFETKNMPIRNLSELQLPARSRNNLSRKYDQDSNSNDTSSFDVGSLYYHGDY